MSYLRAASSSSASAAAVDLSGREVVFAFPTDVAQTPHRLQEASLPAEEMRGRTAREAWSGLRADGLERERLHLHARRVYENRRDSLNFLLSPVMAAPLLLRSSLMMREIAEDLPSLFTAGHRYSLHQCSKSAPADLPSGSSSIGRLLLPRRSFLEQWRPVGGPVCIRCTRLELVEPDRTAADAPAPAPTAAADAHLAPPFDSAVAVSRSAAPTISRKRNYSSALPAAARSEDAPAAARADPNAFAEEEFCGGGDNDDSDDDDDRLHVTIARKRPRYAELPNVHHASAAHIRLAGDEIVFATVRLHVGTEQSQVEPLPAWAQVSVGSSLSVRSSSSKIGGRRRACVVLAATIGSPPVDTKVSQPFVLPLNILGAHRALDDEPQCDWTSELHVLTFRSAPAFRLLGDKIGSKLVEMRFVYSANQITDQDDIEEAVKEGEVAAMRTPDTTARIARLLYQTASPDVAARMRDLVLLSTRSLHLDSRVAGVGLSQSQLEQLDSDAMAAATVELAGGAAEIVSDIQTAARTRGGERIQLMKHQIDAVTRLAAAADSRASPPVSSAPIASCPLPGQLCVFSCVRDDGRRFSLWHNFLTGYSSLEELRYPLESATRHRRLLCDPPGAGKTLAVLAAIREVWERNRRSAPSRPNRCSLLVTRVALIQQWVETTLRFFAPMRVAVLVVQSALRAKMERSIDELLARRPNRKWRGYVHVVSSEAEVQSHDCVLCLADWLSFHRASMQGAYQCLVSDESQMLQGQQCRRLLIDAFDPVTPPQAAFSVTGTPITRTDLQDVAFQLRSLRIPLWGDANWMRRCLLYPLLMETECGARHMMLSLMAQLAVRHREVDIPFPSMDERPVTCGVPTIVEEVLQRVLSWRGASRTVRRLAAAHPGLAIWPTRAPTDALDMREVTRELLLWVAVEKRGPCDDLASSFLDAAERALVTPNRSLEIYTRLDHLRVELDFPLSAESLIRWNTGSAAAMQRVNTAVAHNARECGEAEVETRFSSARTQLRDHIEEISRRYLADTLRNVHHALDSVRQRARVRADAAAAINRWTPPPRAIFLPAASQAADDEARIDALPEGVWGTLPDPVVELSNAIESIGVDSDSQAILYQLVSEDLRKSMREVPRRVSHDEMMIECSKDMSAVMALLEYTSSLISAIRTHVWQLDGSDIRALATAAICHDDKGAPTLLLGQRDRITAEEERRLARMVRSHHRRATFESQASEPAAAAASVPVSRSGVELTAGVFFSMCARCRLRHALTCLRRLMTNDPGSPEYSWHMAQQVFVDLLERAYKELRHEWQMVMRSELRVTYEDSTADDTIDVLSNWIYLCAVRAVLAARRQCQSMGALCTGGVDFRPQSNQPVFGVADMEQAEFTVLHKNPLSAISDADANRLQLLIDTCTRLFHCEDVRNQARSQMPLAWGSCNNFLSQFSSFIHRMQRIFTLVSVESKAGAALSVADLHQMADPMVDQSPDPQEVQVQQDHSSKRRDRLLARIRECNAFTAKMREDPSGEAAGLLSSSTKFMQIAAALKQMRDRCAQAAVAHDADSDMEDHRYRVLLIAHDQRVQVALHSYLHRCGFFVMVPTSAVTDLKSEMDEFQFDSAEPFKVMIARVEEVGNGVNLPGLHAVMLAQGFDELRAADQAALRARRVGVRHRPILMRFQTAGSVEDHMSYGTLPQSVRQQREVDTASQVQRLSFPHAAAPRHETDGDRPKKKKRTPAERRHLLSEATVQAAHHRRAEQLHTAWHLPREVEQLTEDDDPDQPPPHDVQSRIAQMIEFVVQAHLPESALCSPATRRRVIELCFGVEYAHAVDAASIATRRNDSPLEIDGHDRFLAHLRQNGMRVVAHAHERDLFATVADLLKHESSHGLDVEAAAIPAAASSSTDSRATLTRARLAASGVRRPSPTSRDLMYQVMLELADRRQIAFRPFLRVDTEQRLRESADVVDIVCVQLLAIVLQRTIWVVTDEEERPMRFDPLYSAGRMRANAATHMRLGLQRDATFVPLCADDGPTVKREEMEEKTI